MEELPQGPLAQGNKEHGTGRVVTSWERLSTRFVHRSSHFELYEDILQLPNGETMLYTRFESPPFSTVVPVTDEGEIVFVDNYRPPVGESLLELPGGMMDPGETPRQTALRELEEETGYRAKKLVLLGWFYPSPHISSHRGNLFMARNLVKGKARPEESEGLRTILLPVRDAYKKLRAGQIHQSTAMLGLFMAEPFMTELKPRLRA
jgi:ADP-ribose pyrophosphatase